MQLGMLGKYELMDYLGHGAFGTVYLAKHRWLNYQVALKVIESETEDLGFKEARLLVRLSHPNIVKVNDADVIDGKVIVDMEYLPGMSLKQLLQQEKQLPLDRALKIIAQTLNALEYAHENDVVHRDLKPANIMIGANDTLKVVDFGIADVLGSYGYLAGAGTPPYMAPECFLNKSDKRSDVYSVGVVLYQMLIGQLPHQAASNTETAWKEKILNKPQKAKPLSEFLPDVPNGLQGIVNLALVYDKQRRFQTATEFLDALKRNGFYRLPNTEAELRLIDRFEAVYNRVDKQLRQELGSDRKTGFSDVVRQYAELHSEWPEADDLLRLARVRNTLRHEMTKADQWRPVPPVADIEKLEGIDADLAKGHSGLKPVVQPFKAPDVTPVSPPTPKPVQIVPAQSVEPLPVAEKPETPELEQKAVVKPIPVVPKVTEPLKSETVKPSIDRPRKNTSHWIWAIVLLTAFAAIGSRFLPHQFLPHRFLPHQRIARSSSLDDARRKGIAAFDEKRYPDALKILQPLAEQGDKDAEWRIGYIYEKGLEESQRDALEAVEWYRKAADAGSAEAMNNLGVMYDTGEGVPKDYRDAIKWLRKAAEAGEAVSMTSLGKMYESGHGVTRNYQEAAKWDRKAAAAGEETAMYNLGGMYEDGNGVSKNIQEAVWWYRKAAAAGDAKAKDALARLAKQ